MNKMDLADPISDLRVHKEMLERNACQSPAAVYHTHLNSPEKQRKLLSGLLRSIPRIVGHTYALPETSEKFTDTNTDSGSIGCASISCLAVGIPNAGKSTLINALRGIGRGGPAKAVRVGRLAGQTRSVGQPVVVARGENDSRAFGGGIVSGAHRITIADTPGVLEPKARSLTEQLSLCVCGAVDPSSVNKEILVDYLLWWWNYRNRLDYVDKLGLEGPTDDVNELLVQVCLRNGFFDPNTTHSLHRRSRWEPNEVESLGDIQAHRDITRIVELDRAANHVLRLFNMGALGRATFLPEDEQAASNFFVAA